MKALIFNSLSDVSNLEDLGVIIDFTPEEENFQPDYDDEDNQRISEDYNNGNAAAWFCAKVEVSYRGFSGTDYLGGCSYKSFREFTSEESGYYPDMISTCIDEVNREIQQHNDEIQKAWNIRKAKNLVAPYGLKIVSGITYA